MPKFFNKKTATVRFHGFNEEKKYQNSKSDIIVSKRLIELIAVTLVLIFILIIRLAYVQLTQADTLEVKLETYGSTTYTKDAPRGEIYDRNYTKIMGNQNVICVDYYAPKKITNKEITYIAKFLSEKITIDFSKNNVNNITERNIKDYFIIAHEKLAESLLSDKELKKLKTENPDDADYSKAKTNLIVSKLSTATGQDKLLVLEGNPAFVDEADFDKLNYIVLNTAELTNVTDLKLQVTGILANSLLSKDKLLLSVQMGGQVIDETCVKQEAVTLMTDRVVALGPLAGLGIYAIGNDYYSPIRNYEITRTVIQLMNPSK